MTSVAQLPVLRPRPGIAKALEHLTGSTLRSERDTRVFKAQLLEALHDPAVLAAISEAVQAPQLDEDQPSDMLDYDGASLVDSDEESVNGVQANAAAVAAPEAEEAALAPRSPHRSRSERSATSVAKRAAFVAKASSRVARQSNKTLDTIGADAVGDMVDSHYTMTAWLLSPTHAELTDTPGKRWKTVQYGAIGMGAVIAQCLIVKALIADLIDTERWGNGADDALGNVKGLEKHSSIIGREMPYCRSELKWNQFIEQQLAADHVPYGKLCWPAEECGDGETPMNVSLIDEANLRFGYINNCWAGSDLGKDMSWMEIVTDVVLTLFLGFEIYAEQQELFLQALMFHAVPRAADGVTSSGGLSQYSGKTARTMYCVRLWCYTIFIGFRFYLLGLVSLASAVLIVSDASIAEAVLNGIALLFIVEFDNKMWRVGSWGNHSRERSDGSEYRACYKEKLLSSWNIRPLLRTQEWGTAMYATVAMIITFAVELYARHSGRLFNLSDTEKAVQVNGASAFSSESVTVLWENGLGFVSVYIVIAVVALALCNLRIHFGRVPGRGRRQAPKTTVHPHTSAMMIVLILAGSLIATKSTESLLLGIVKRGEPTVAAKASVIGRSGGQLQLKWESKIVKSDNFAFDGKIFYYLLGHFCILMLLVFISEVAAEHKETRASAGTAVFYAVTSLVFVGFGVIIFLDEVWPLL